MSNLARGAGSANETSQPGESRSRPSGCVVAPAPGARSGARIVTVRYLCRLVVSKRRSRRSGRHDRRESRQCHGQLPQPDLDEAASRQAHGTASSVCQDDCVGADAEVRYKQYAWTDQALPRPTAPRKAGSHSIPIKQSSCQTCHRLPPSRLIETAPAIKSRHARWLCRRSSSDQA
jgi:hypothetical protein